MLRCKVERTGNSLVLKAADELIPAFAYVTYNPAEGRYDQFAREGVRLFSVTVYMGDQGINSMSGIRPFRPGFWKARDVYDFSMVGEDFRRIVANVPNALIFPRIHFDVPIWWEMAHPAEVARDQSGTPLRQSFSSRVWLDDCREALQRFYEWIMQSGWDNYVIGCQVASGGTEEWYYHRTFPDQLLDYSETNRAAFAGWVRQRYNDDLDALNVAWRSQLPSFDAVAIPLPLERKSASASDGRNAKKELHVIEYEGYHSWSVANAIISLCRYVKEASGEHHVAGAFYGYVLENANADFGHSALNYVLDSEYVDFLASPASYTRSRSMGVDWPPMAPVESVMLHGKMWFIEADVRTCLTHYLKESMPFAVPDNMSYETTVWKGPDTVEQSIGAMGKVFARALTHGTALWWFDMWAGWYDHPELMNFIHSAAELYKKAMLDGGASSVAQTALIVDEASYALFSEGDGTMQKALSEQCLELGFLGAPYDSYLFSDLDKIPVENYRMIIFLNATKISPYELNELRSRYGKDGRTLVWLGIISVPDEGDTGYSPHRRSGLQKTVDELAECSTPYLLRRNENGQPLLVMTKKEGYNEVLSTAPCISAGIFREIAVISGVHIYCHTGEVVYANDDYIAVHAASDGPKRVYFPRRTDGEWILSKGKAIRRELYHDFDMKLGQTVIWHIWPAG